MRNIFWKLVLFVSVATLMSGMIISLFGVYYQDHMLAYSGLAVIALTCISWWIWVMVVIKSMWDFAQSTVENVFEIRLGIKDVRRLVEEYKNTTER